MGHFETKLLQDYKKKFRKVTALWLRFIDDVFIIWPGSQAEFRHLIKFCNGYASSKGYKSNTKFTSS